MKSKQIVHLVGLVALLIVAALIDFAYSNIGFDTEITLSSGLIQFLVSCRGLILVVFYGTFFFIAAQMINSKDPNHLQTWIILGIGVVIVSLVGVLPYGGNKALRFFRDQIFGSLNYPILMFDHAYLKLVLHYGALLTAMSLSQFGRQFIQKKQK